MSDLEADLIRIADRLDKEAKHWQEHPEYFHAEAGLLHEHDDEDGARQDQEVPGRTGVFPSCHAHGHRSQGPSSTTSEVGAMMGNITLTFDGVVWRSGRMTEEESVNIIANIRAKFFLAPINFKIEWVEGEE